MIKSAVTISLVPEARGGPFVFWDDLAAGCRMAARLKFHAVEVFAPSATALEEAGLRQQLQKNNLALAAVGTGAGWVLHRLTLSDPDDAVRRRAIDFVRSIIDVAGPLGAPAIVGSMQGLTATTDLLKDQPNRLWDALEQLGEHARQYGVPLLYESLNRYETKLVKSLTAGVSVLTVTLRKGANVKLLGDLFHMNIEDVNPPDSIRQAGPLLGHVHLADSNRRPAGCGHIDFRAVAQALRDIGYSGYVSAECLPHPNPYAAARQTMKAYRQFFSEAPRA